MPAVSWLLNLKERSHLEKVGVDGKIILKGTLKGEEGRALSRPIRLIVVTNGCFFSTRSVPYGDFLG